MNPSLIRLLITAASVAVAVSVLMATRRRFDHHLLKQNNDFTGYTYAAVSMIYGVYLAFTVIVVSGQYGDAGRTAASEAVHLSEVWRDTSTLPAPLRAAVHDRLMTYASDVVTREWPVMASTYQAEDNTGKAYEDLWMALYDARAGITTPADLAFFNAAIVQMNELGMQRRLRILSSTSALPTIMWLLLICGGILTIVFTFAIGVRHFLLQALATSALTALIVFSLLLVAALEHPFSGDLRIKPDAFESVLKSFATRPIPK